MEITVSGPEMYGPETKEFLENLAHRCKRVLGTNLEIKYSGEKTGPMAPIAYYWIGRSVPKSRLGPIVITKELEPVFIFYPGVYGRGIGVREMFCAVCSPKIMDIVKEELQVLGEKLQLTGVRINAMFKY